MLRRLRGWLPLALLLNGCMTEPASPQAQVDTEVTRLPGGRHYRAQIGPASDTIRYAVYVPGGAPLEGGHPLIVAAHFGGEVTPWLGGAFAELLVVPAVLSQVPAVIVAPDAGSRSGWSAADEERVMWLAARIREVYPIRADRVIITGFSAGGAQTWRLANRHQDFFTAAVPVSARPPQQTEHPWRIPVRVVHSRDDELIPFASVEAYVTAQQEAGAPVHLQAVSGIGHYQTAAFAQALREAVEWALAGGR